MRCRARTILSVVVGIAVTAAGCVRTAPSPAPTPAAPGALPSAATAGTPIATSSGAVVPDTVEFQSGSLSLRGLVYLPSGAGPYPAVLFLHGSGNSYDREVAEVGPLYANQGYLLFVPFRRGQGLSAGRGQAIRERLAAEGRAGGRDAAMRLMSDLLATEQMDDVLAALEYLRRRPDVDTGRIAVAGNSFGGILTVFSAARAPGIRAAVASAPAALTWARAPELRERLREAAREARVPIFFFQAENDQDLTPTEVLAAEMAAAGRPHRRKIYPAFGTTVEEGHGFGYFGGALYGPDVFAFLAETLGTRASGASPR